MQFGSSENDKSANFQRATCFSACDFCLGGYIWLRSLTQPMDTIQVTNLHRGVRNRCSKAL